NHCTISLLSASSAVQVHTSPAPSTGFFMFGTFFCLAAQNDQISSTCTRLETTPRTFSSWKAAHASPASTSILPTVLMLTSTTREIDRMETPSQSIERIWTRFARGSLFMPLLYEPLCLASS